jgi:ATP-dependent RNA helicase DDX5/DBP2
MRFSSVSSEKIGFPKQQSPLVEPKFYPKRFTNFNNSRSQQINEDSAPLKTFPNMPSQNAASSTYQNDARFSMHHLGINLKPVDWNTVTLTPITKNLLDVEKTKSKLTDDEAERWRKENQITIFGRDCPPPILSFEELTFFPELFVQELTKLYKKPTIIQSQSWPLIMRGRDTIGSAETGSGKTLAFALPALVHIQKQPVQTNQGPTVLVLCPTRELTQQVAQEFTKYAKLISLRVGFCHGGTENRFSQINQMLRKPHVVVATPGRLIDFLENNYISLKTVSYLVLDEADRMLDMGFEPQIRAIMGQLRPDRQTLMWSATWPKEVQMLANDFLNDSVRIHVGPLSLSANPDVTQKIIICDGTQSRDTKFFELLKQLNLKEEKVLIFTQTKRTADWLQVWIQKMTSIACEAIHGDKSQRARDLIMRRFREGYVRVLIATDLASRGIDVRDITLVINYDFPVTIEDYVHRIGRTGRAGSKGNAVSFFTPNDYHHIHDLLDVMRQSRQEIPPELKQVLADQQLIELARREALRKQTRRTQTFKSM